MELNNIVYYLIYYKPLPPYFSLLFSCQLITGVFSGFTGTSRVVTGKSLRVTQYIPLTVLTLHQHITLFINSFQIKNIGSYLSKRRTLVSKLSTLRFSWFTSRSKALTRLSNDGLGFEPGDGVG